MQTVERPWSRPSSSELAARLGGQVQYQLTATLEPAVATGFFKDEISLLTNDPTIPTSRSR